MMSVSDPLSPVGQARSGLLGGREAEFNRSAALLFERIATDRAGLAAGPRSEWRLALLMVAVDVLGVALGFGAAVMIAGLLRGPLGLPDVTALSFLVERGKELMLLLVLGIAIFGFGGLYRRGSWELEEVKRIVAGVALLAMFDTALQYITRDHNSRLWFATAYPMVVVSVVALRTGIRALPIMRRAITNHVVLLGSGIAPDLLIFELRESRANPVALLRAFPLAGLERQCPERFEQMLNQVASQAGVPGHRMQIVLAPMPDEIAEAQSMIDLLNAVRRPYSVILPFSGLARNGLALQKVIGADMIMAEVQPVMQHWSAHAVKRIFDFSAAGFGVVLLLPALVILAGLLALEGGPIFFSQVRIGRDGRRFRCWKFRTMRPDAEARLEELLSSDPAAKAEWARYQKLRRDPRITPVGHFLRRTSLDELPQLLNVLLGEMSLVGPRPIVAPEVPGYPKDRAYYESPDFAYYIRCMPGLTGLWQVSGRNETAHEERIRLDRWYARNQSIWLDFVILLKTIRVVLGRNGSA